jgi:hypothetical protein
MAVLGIGEDVGEGVAQRLAWWRERLQEGNVLGEGVSDFDFRHGGWFYSNN